MKTIQSKDDTQYGSAANGMTYQGRTVGSGYDVIVKRESRSTALVNVMTPDGSIDSLAAIDVEPDENLQEVAIDFANCPEFGSGIYVDPEEEEWDEMAARWDAIEVSSVEPLHYYNVAGKLNVVMTAEQAHRWNAGHMGDGEILDLRAGIPYDTGADTTIGQLVADGRITLEDLEYEEAQGPTTADVR